MLKRKLQFSHILSPIDVWSFGVICFEVAFRKMPYESIDNPIVVMQRVAHEGLRLEVPDKVKKVKRVCSMLSLQVLCYQGFSDPSDEEFWQLCVACTHPDPHERPSFGDIVARLTQSKSL